MSICTASLIQFDCVSRHSHGDELRIERSYDRAAGATCETTP